MLFYTIGSVVYYFCIWLTSILIVRLSGYSDAGIYSLAFTVTASPAVVGLFNMRNYQVSDIKGEYSDSVYIFSRVITSVISVIVCVGLAGVYGYLTQPKKFAVIMVYMLLKVVESMVDVYHGIFQKNARLDYAAVSFLLRGIGSLILFVGGYMVTQSLVASVLLMTIYSWIVMFIYDQRIVKRYIGEPPNNESCL